MEELIEKIKKGDEEAYIELIQLVQKDLFNVAFIKLNNIEDVNDVIQETMLKFVKNINKLREEKCFKIWITKILINECNKTYIRRYKQKDLFEKIQKMHDNFNFVDKESYNIDNKIDFELLVHKLNYNEQVIVVLYFNNNFTTGEISEILNISVNTVKTRLRRAEEKMREIIRKDEKELFK